MGPASNIHFLNNLILGDGWADPIFNLRTYTNYSSSDYNGFRPNPGVDNSFEWTSPAFGTDADFVGKLVTRNFKSFAEYQQATKQDQRSMLIDYDIFVKAWPPNKNDPQRLYNPEDFDLRLKPASNSSRVEPSVAGGTLPLIVTDTHLNPAVDAGVLLPTINDDFTGSAPDLGAYESDRPLPHYGPRSQPLGAPESSAPRSVTGPPN
jgi:hypothetical protein